MNMTKSLIGIGNHTERWITDNTNTAWNDLGDRHIKGVVWHTMYGSLWGTDAYFRMMVAARATGNGALTDAGMSSSTGELLLWNDDLGRARPGCSQRRAPWASGPVQNPIGDALAFLNKYGWDYNVINRDEVALEIDGFADTPLSAAARKVIVRYTAHYAHDYGITYKDWPAKPVDGFNFVRWHGEIYSGKRNTCPNNAVRAATDLMYADIKNLLQKYQEEQVAPTPPLVTPPPIYVPFLTVTVLHAKAGAVAREYGNRSAKVIRTFSQRTAIKTTGYYRGQSVNGDDRWLVITSTGPSNGARIHASGIEEQKEIASIPTRM